MLRAIRTGALVAGTVAAASSVASEATSTRFSGEGEEMAGDGRRTAADTRMHEGKRMGTYLDIGVDSQEVRRKDAPPRRKYGKGLLQSARRMFRTTKARKQGTEKLLRDRYAPTTRKAMQAKTATLMTLISDAGVDVVPITVDSMNVIAAALKEGGYRTGTFYLGLWENMHREAGHAWTTDLAQAKQWAKRSMERGMGPARRAATVVLEKVVAQTGENEFLDVVVVGSLWMLRGAELAGLLVEQATLSKDGLSAALMLGAHKTNVEASWCERSLIGSCKQGDLGSRLCPVHALGRLLHRRGAGGTVAKQPLIPGRSGQALTHEEARTLIRKACKEKTLSEHSLRRMGAQFYARRGIGLQVIQYLGRWGSAAVEKYVAEAVAGKASWAPLIAATELDVEAVVGGHSSGVELPSFGTLAGMISKLVKAEVSKATTIDKDQIRTIADTGIGVATAERNGLTGDGQYIRSIKGVGHVIRFGGPRLPPEQWETACGWFFGFRAHAPCTEDEVTCKKCLAEYGCARSAASGSAVPLAPSRQQSSRL